MLVLDPLKKNNLKIASKLLKYGYLVAFPTETVYGVGCVYDNFNAYKKLNILKKRSENKPYTFMLSKFSDINKYAIFSNKKIKKFLKKILPGPITVILPAKKSVPSNLICNKTIGIRIPKCKIILKIIDFINKAILAPSLNISGQKPLNSIDEIKKNFDNQIKAIVKTNTILSDKASTIITFENDKIRVLRHGKISSSVLERIYDNT
ncbi:MAG: threonylcarbamoyl-AMP synthase [Bacilli bacterium]|nr:threonylcarbamoyl-AMP synthase [Bacilli bacterium]